MGCAENVPFAVFKDAKNLISILSLGAFNALQPDRYFDA